MRKVRVHEIAQQLDLTSDQVIEKLRARGEPVTSASSSVHAAVADLLIALVRTQGRPATPPVLRRRATTGNIPRVAEPVAMAPEEPAPAPLELFDVKTRYERELAAARDRGKPAR